MPSFADLIQQGSAHAWLFIPSAILLGALHGLEPGHSKTMMAAFIVAIRGTVTQAVLLGLAATVSHTLVVWGIALGGMYLWQGVDAEASSPISSSSRPSSSSRSRSGCCGAPGRTSSAAKAAAGRPWPWRTAIITITVTSRHGEDVRRIDTGHGVVAVEVFENGVPPRWRIRTERGHGWARQRCRDRDRAPGRRHGRPSTSSSAADYLEFVDEIPEPHEFMARSASAMAAIPTTTTCPSSREHGHDHMHEEMQGLEVATDGYQDAHELAHANDIRRRFADRNVTTWQIVLFGLTGGLIPCPAAITVLLLCLQLKEFTLGFALVLCFSIGLAITLVAVGGAAALSVRHATRAGPGSRPSPAGRPISRASSSSLSASMSAITAGPACRLVPGPSLARPRRHVPLPLRSVEIDPAIVPLSPGKRTPRRTVGAEVMLSCQNSTKLALRA